MTAFETDTTTPTPTRDRPWSDRGLAVAGLGVGWTLIAVAETVIGELDALDSVATVSAGSDRVAAAGLLHFASALFLTVGLVGLARVARRTRLAQVGWWLSLPTAVGMAAFAQTHLLALQTTTDGLDAGAMDAFLTTGLGAVGPWVIPMTFVALTGPWAIGLLLVGLSRQRLFGWWVPALWLAGAAAHLFLGTPATEVASQWLMAAAGVLAAASVARGRTW
jgi:hypothetical protein